MEPKVVKHGFNWWALFFPLFWCFANRLFKQWFYGFSFLIVTAIIWMLAVIILDMKSLLSVEVSNTVDAVNYLQILLGYFYGLKCNEWLRNDLIEEGYSRHSIVSASNKKDAIAKYYSMKTS